MDRRRVLGLSRSLRIYAAVTDWLARRRGNPHDGIFEGLPFAGQSPGAAYEPSGGSTSPPPPPPPPPGPTPIQAPFPPTTGPTRTPPRPPTPIFAPLPPTATNTDSPVPVQTGLPPIGVEPPPPPPMPPGPVRVPAPLPPTVGPPVPPVPGPLRVPAPLPPTVGPPVPPAPGPTSVMAPRPPVAPGSSSPPGIGPHANLPTLPPSLNVEAAASPVWLPVSGAFGTGGDLPVNQATDSQSYPAPGDVFDGVFEEAFGAVWS